MCKLIKTINIYSEENYDLFCLNPNNRGINENHVKSLARDIQIDGYNVNFPIIVKRIGDKYMIFKGHHRFLACKSINHPIIFTINNDLEDIDLIKGEKVQKAIDVKDSIEMYVSLGYEHYVKFDKLLKEYKLTKKIGVMLLRGCYSDGQAVVKYGKLVLTDEDVERFRIRATNYNRVKNCARLYTSQNTDYLKILPVLDDIDLTLKFAKYLKHRSFSIAMSKADFKRENGKDYSEYIKDLVKDIEL